MARLGWTHTAKAVLSTCKCKRRVKSKAVGDLLRLADIVASAVAGCACKHGHPDLRSAFARKSARGKKRKKKRKKRKSSRRDHGESIDGCETMNSPKGSQNAMERRSTYLAMEKQLPLIGKCPGS